MRLFVAILLPATVRQQLLKAVEALREQGNGNFTKERNLHLTLAFLGQTPNLRAAVRAVHQVQEAALELQFEGVGAFGDLIWAGVKKTPELMALQRQVSMRLREAGFVLQTRPFQPHLTLCRKFRPNGNAVSYKPVERVLSGLISPVSKISLMESVREQGQLVYREQFFEPLQ